MPAHTAPRPAHTARHHFLIWVLLSACAAIVQAHPLHASVTEADYNRETCRLELAIRLFPDDFAESLSRHTGRPIAIEELAGLADTAFAYLKKHFVVLSAEGAPLTLSWVGIEVAAAHVWLYCEVPMTGGLQGTRFRVSLLQREFADQSNSIHLRDGTFRQTMVFTRDTTEKIAGE